VSSVLSILSLVWNISVFLWGAFTRKLFTPEQAVHSLEVSHKYCMNIKEILVLQENIYAYLDAWSRIRMSINSAEFYCFTTSRMWELDRRRLSTKELMLLNYGAGEDSWKSHGLQGDQTSQSWRTSALNIHGKDWYWSSNTLATWCEEPTHWKRPWWWKRSRPRGEEGDRGWNDWISSLTEWTRVWPNFRK